MTQDMRGTQVVAQLVDDRHVCVSIPRYQECATIILGNIIFTTPKNTSNSGSSYLSYLFICTFD